MNTCRLTDITTAHNEGYRPLTIPITMWNKKPASHAKHMAELERFLEDCRRVGRDHICVESWCENGRCVAVWVRGKHKVKSKKPISKQDHEAAADKALKDLRNALHVPFRGLSTII